MDKKKKVLYSKHGYKCWFVGSTMFYGIKGFGRIR